MFFCHKEDFYVPLIENFHLIGLSLVGTVKDISGNKIQIQLDIDAMQKNDRWYQYAAFYSMFYCMPEKGDRVFLYFPDANECSAFVLNSVQTNLQESKEKENIYQNVKDVLEKSDDRNNTTLYEKEEGKHTVDITPYLDTLNAPDSAQLINLSVEFTDGMNASLKDLANIIKEGNDKRNDTTKKRSDIDSLDTQNCTFEQLALDNRIKILSTLDGKKVILNDAEGSVSIYLNSSTYVRMIGNSVQIRSSGNITLWADGNVNITAKQSVILEAEKELALHCQDSRVELFPDKLKISGTDIKLN